MRRTILHGVLTAAAVASVFAWTNSACADDPVFSGPQVGEKLTPFGVRAVLGEAAGKEFDLVSDAEGAPLVLVFVHEVTRPSIGLMRAVIDYAKKQEGEGLRYGVVFLGQDATEAEAFIKRAQHAMPPETPLGVSVDGLEGPGAYGLNRNVTLTILVGKDSVVTANFALVQPSLAVDAPEIGHAIVKVLGGDKKPTLAEMAPDRAAMMRREAQTVDDGTLRSLIAPVIRQGATEEQVAAAAKKVEEYAAEHEAFKHRVATIANRIIDAGRLESYGTPAAQEYLRKWAQEFAAESAEDEAREAEKENKPDEATSADDGAEGDDEQPSEGDSQNDDESDK